MIECNRQGSRLRGILIASYSVAEDDARRQLDAALPLCERYNVRVGVQNHARNFVGVNLKNGYWRRTTGPEAKVAEWKVYWTSGRQGRADWRRVVAKLKRMNYIGPICLTAEYSDPAAVDRLIVEDLAYACSLSGPKMALRRGHRR